MSRINQTLENRIVDLDRVRQNNIVPLDLGKPLNETIFQQEYQTAIRLINEIVQRSQNYQEKRNSVIARNTCTSGQNCKPQCRLSGTAEQEKLP